MRLLQLLTGSAAALCALHCLLTLALLSLLPLSALSVSARGSLGHELLRYALWLHGYERLLLAFAMPLTLTLLFRRWRRHGGAAPLRLAVAAAMLVAASFLGDARMHFLAAAAGGVLAAVALFLDQRRGLSASCLLPSGGR